MITKKKLISEINKLRRDNEVLEKQNENYRLEIDRIKHSEEFTISRKEKEDLCCQVIYEINNSCILHDKKSHIDIYRSVCPWGMYTNIMVENLDTHRGFSFPIKWY